MTPHDYLPQALATNEPPLGNKFPAQGAHLFEPDSKGMGVAHLWIDGPLGSMTGSGQEQ